MAWIRTIGMREADAVADPALAAVYTQMQGRPMPAVYRPPHGDVAGIVRAHSLDPELMLLTFAGVSSSISAGTGADALTWPQRELVNTVTSRANQCFY